MLIVWGSYKSVLGLSHWLSYGYKKINGSKTLTSNTDLMSPSNIWLYQSIISGYVQVCDIFSNNFKSYCETNFLIGFAPARKKNACWGFR